MFRLFSLLVLACSFPGLAWFSHRHILIALSWRLREAHWISLKLSLSAALCILFSEATLYSENSVFCKAFLAFSDSQLCQLKDCWTPYGFPLPRTWKLGNSLQTVNWVNCSLIMVVSCLSGITVLNCLTSNVWKPLFHTFCSVTLLLLQMIVSIVLFQISGSPGWRIFRDCKTSA